MKKEKKIIEIKRVVVDEELYPRNAPFWQTAYNYSQAMKSGAKFPDIVVAELDGSYVLVDGRHRLEANKRLKEKYIQAEILKGLTKAEIYKEAVGRNITHGQKLSTYDIVKSSKKLAELGFSMEEVAKIVNMPKASLVKLLNQRVTSSLSGKDVVLKRSMKHLAGSELNKEFDFNQLKYGGASQEYLLKQLLNLIEDGLLDTENEKIVKLCKELSKKLMGVL